MTSITFRIIFFVELILISKSYVNTANNYHKQQIPNEFICPPEKCQTYVCPAGTIWNATAKHCERTNKEPTILEVNNLIINEITNNIGMPCLEESEPPKVPEITETTTTELTTSTTTTSTTPTTTPKTTTTTRTTTTTEPPLESSTPAIVVETTTEMPTAYDCCAIISPRVCKNYGKKWICFNRRLKKCDRSICLYPMIYLRTPQIVSMPPILVMPPNPPLQACTKSNCHESDIVDCSGCVENIRETCSPSCYQYICPQKACGFLDLKVYCQHYPGEFGCQLSDGCIFDWCNTNATTTEKCQN